MGQGIKPLALAAGLGDMDIVRLLLDNNVDIGEERSWSLLPILLDADYDYDLLVSVLENYGAKTEAAIAALQSNAFRSSTDLKARCLSRARLAAHNLS